MHEHLDGARRTLVDDLMDKWSLQVLAALCDGPLRFNELRRTIPELKQKSLVETLRRLERNGMVERQVQATGPVAVRYSVTDLARTLEQPLLVLLRWAVEHVDAVQRHRDSYDRAHDDALLAGVERALS